MKTCTKCSEEKPLDEFPFQGRNKAGVRKKSAQCKKCVNAFVKKHYHENPAEHMLRRAYARAARKGLDFSLTVGDITPMPTHCPVFGQKLTRGNGQQEPNAFSLDRIDNAKGYVPGNVSVISYLANRLKNDGTAEQHLRIAEWMETK